MTGGNVEEGVRLLCTNLVDERGRVEKLPKGNPPRTVLLMKMPANIDSTMKIRILENFCRSTSV